jgi:hypothetical protein
MRPRLAWPLIHGMESLLEEVTAGVYNEEEAIVLEWRIDSLMRAGYAPEAAFDLAFCKHVDLHTAVGLVKRGCPADTALRILL